MIMDLATSLNELTFKVESQINNTGNIETKIDDINSNIENKIGDVNSKIGDLKQILLSVKNNMNSNFSEIETELEIQEDIERKIDDLDADLNDLGSGIVAISADILQKIDDLEEDVYDMGSGLGNQIYDLEEDVYEMGSGLGNQIYDLEEDVKYMGSGLRNQIYGLDEDMIQMGSGLENKINNVDRDVDDMNADISNQINELDNDVYSWGSGLRHEIYDLEYDVYNMGSGLGAELDKIEDKLDAIECPEGFYAFNPWHQCFKFINKKVSWEDAKIACHDEGLQLAIPMDPVPVTDWLARNEVDDDEYVWIDARGNGNGNIVWQRTGEVISNDNRYWYTENSGMPSDYTSAYYCLELLTDYYYIEKVGMEERPFYVTGCTKLRYPLCELIRSDDTGTYKFEAANTED